MATSKRLQHIALTGAPGVGKTTLIQRVYEKLLSEPTEKLQPVVGFFTEEVRCPQSKSRTGFRVVTIPDKETAILATTKHENINSRVKQLGKYCVLLDSFEPLLLKCLKKVDTSKLLIVDEIGKMECFSKPFCNEILRIFDNQVCTILATIPISTTLPTVENIRSRDNVNLIVVTANNRDKLVDDLYALLLANVK